MFDDLDKQNATPQPPSRQNDSVGLVSGGTTSPTPPSAHSGQAFVKGEAIRKTEDIFAEVDQGSKPAVLKPRAADSKMPPSTVIPEEETWRKNKILIFGLIFGGLLVVVVGGYFGLKLATGGVPTVKETVVQEAVKNNQPTSETTNTTAEPPAQETNAPLSQPVEPAQVTQPVDTDQDGLTDAEEAQLGTNPNQADTDQDGLTDREEVKVYGTDPLKADTDGDGYNDGDEVKNGYNPKGPGKLLNINQ